MDPQSRRLCEVEKLSNFMTGAENFFDDVISDLGWTVEHLKNGPMNSKVCPISANHWMPRSSLPKHLEVCASKSDYTGPDQEMASRSSNFFYAKSTSVVPVLIDKVLQQQILSAAAAKNPFDKGIRTEVLDVPPTVDHCITDLSREERLAIYDFVVERSKETKKPIAFSVDDLQMNFEAKKNSVSESKTRLELLAEMRDYKRRRQSYRAKNVHITKKSYTEVLREVIANQSQFLEELTCTETPKETSPPGNDEDLQRSSDSRRKHDRRDTHSSDSSPERKHSKHSKEHKSDSHRHHKHKRHREHRSKKKRSRSRSTK